MDLKKKSALQRPRKAEPSQIYPSICWCEIEIQECKNSSNYNVLPDPLFFLTNFYPELVIAWLVVLYFISYTRHYSFRCVFFALERCLVHPLLKGQ